jgi:Bacterial transcriptional activator domain
VAIETQRGGYRLAVPLDDVDACRFERLVGRAGELLTFGEPERAAHVVGDALALWRGRALARRIGSTRRPGVSDRLCKCVT